MAVLYRHIRLDKNEPFYIGIGKTVSRAYSYKQRSKSWKDVVNLSEYEVDILFEDLTWEEACEKEKEFISIYGRRDFKKGTLVNHTDGGEGLNNITEEVRESKRLKMKGKNTGPRPENVIEKLRKIQTGKKQTFDTVEKRVSKFRGVSHSVDRVVNRSNKCKKVVEDVKTGIVYNSVTEAAKTLGLSLSSISQKLKKGIFKYK